MSLFAKLSLFVFLFTVSILTVINNAYADITLTINPTPVNENTPKTTLQFNNLVVGKDYYFSTVQDGSGNIKTLKDKIKAGSTSISFDVCGGEYNFLITNCGDDKWFNGNIKYTARISIKKENNTLGKLGEISFTVQPFVPEISLGPTGAKNTDQLTVTIKGSRRPANISKRNKYIFDLKGKASDGTNISTTKLIDLIVPASGTGERKFGPLPDGDYTIQTKYSGEVISTITFSIPNTNGAIDSGGGGSSVDAPCVDTCSIGGILNIPVGNSGEIVKQILTVSISIAAVVAFILAGFGAVKITTSVGNPNAINAGRDMIISAISGLLFIVFAVTILEIIGYGILELPGIGL